MKNSTHAHRTITPLLTLPSVHTLVFRNTLVPLLLLLTVATAHSLTVSGTVYDNTGQPLIGAQVLIPSIHRGTVSGTGGKFRIQDLPSGHHLLQCQSIGFKTETIDLTLTDHDTTIAVTLTESPLELPGVTVTARPQAADILSTPQSVAVIGGRTLEQNRGQSVIEAIATLPGVSTYSTGTGVVKPVIRGLTAQRVLIVSDGVRQEGQQWGDEHGPELDGLDVDRIEVVRGPNSVLYGSDALGGVVNVIRPPLPSTSLGAPIVEGNAIINSFSNTSQVAGALGLSGASGTFGYRVNLSGRTASDITTPDGMLTNTGESELNGSASMGTVGEWGSISAEYSHVGQQLELHEDEPDATPFQKIGHDRLRVHGDYHLPVGQLEATAGWQRNDRQEFEEAGADESSLHLKLATVTLDAKLHHQPVGPLIGTIGIAAMSQQNASLAEEKLIPDFSMLDAAVFLYEELELGDVQLSAGGRFDTRQLDVDASGELRVQAQQRSYTAASGTAGVIWHVAKPLSLVGTIGTGWRAPTPFELFVDGVHEGTARYEVGSTTLLPERSMNLEGSIRYVTSDMQTELTAYRNLIHSFIYISPTGRIDSGSGFPIYADRQADAEMIGGEFSIQARITGWMVVHGAASIVRGTNLGTDSPLPLIPADRLTVGTRFIQQTLGPISNPYLSFEATLTSDQTRIAEFETITPGYTLFNAGIGGELPFAGSRLHVDIAVHNLTNTAYRDHLSRYKDFALNPGRDISLKVSLPFTILE